MNKENICPQGKAQPLSRSWGPADRMAGHIVSSCSSRKHKSVLLMRATLKESAHETFPLCLLHLLEVDGLGQFASLLQTSILTPIKIKPTSQSCWKIPRKKPICGHTWNVSGLSGRGAGTAPGGAHWQEEGGTDGAEGHLRRLIFLKTVLRVHCPRASAFCPIRPHLQT